MADLYTRNRNCPRAVGNSASEKNVTDGGKSGVTRGNFSEIRMAPKLTSQTVAGASDIEKFFDHAAGDYREQHGSQEKLLRYRLGLIRSLAHFSASDIVLELGTGPGNHLIPLAPLFASAAGTDISGRMIEIAKQRCEEAGLEDKLQFRTDDAQTLESVPSQSIDVAFCVGAFEHMPDKAAVLRSVARVLRPGGRFVCLTPNGDWLWYRWLAPLLGLHTTRLSTDRFVGAKEVHRSLADCGFHSVRTGYWTFVPRGDMPSICASAMSLLDRVGHVVAPRHLRGGLTIQAVRR